MKISLETHGVWHALRESPVAFCVALCSYETQDTASRRVEEKHRLSSAKLSGKSLVVCGCCASCRFAVKLASEQDSSVEVTA